MNRRYALYVGVIALLALMKAGQWWLHGGKGDPVREKLFLADEFRLRVDIPDSDGAGRNLFLGKGGVSRAEAGEGPVRRVAIRKQPAPAPVAPPPPQPVAPPPVPAEPESALGKLRLLGVVFHGGKRQAYLALDKDHIIAAAGDRVFGEYVVEKIAVDAAELRDTKTNITRKIPVSGK